jgi:hypothetical protein
MLLKKLAALTASSAALTSVLIAGASHVSAQETAPMTPAAAPASAANAPQSGWDFGFSVGVLSFGDEFAADNGLGTNVTELNFDVDYRFSKHVAVTGAFGAAFLDDKQQVEALVCPQYDPNCDPNVEESGEVGFSLQGALRGDFPINSAVTLSGLGGFKYLRHSREIAYCEDCPSGGTVTASAPFVGAQAGFDLGATTLTVRYQHFLGGDELDGGQVLVGLMF